MNGDGSVVTGGETSAPAPAAPAPVSEAVSTPAAQAAESTSTESTPATDQPAKVEESVVAKPDEFLAELDDIDGPAATSEAKPEATDDGTADETPATGEPVAETATDETANTAETETLEDDDLDDGEDGETAEEPPDHANWRKPSPEDEEYIQKNVPKKDHKVVRKAFRDAKTLRAFMNPECEPGVIVENLQKKSAMRYGQLESEILKRNAEGQDPTTFLAKIFEATKDEQGHSEAYQRLLDASINTNPEYVMQAMKRAGYELTSGQSGKTAVELTDADIDGFRESTAFTQLNEILPDDAAKLSEILDSAKVDKAEVARLAQELETAKTAGDETPEQKQAREQQAATYQTNITNFESVYSTNVTTHVNTLLDKTYGLETSADETAKSPMMSRLKAAKRAIIMNGGIDGKGDFDNELYKWGENRPAFKQAAKAMVEYTAAGELDNAKRAAREMQPFVDLFLAERAQSDDVKFIDEMIQLYAAQQKAGLNQHVDTDTPGEQVGRTSTNKASGDLLTDIDDIR